MARNSRGTVANKAASQPALRAGMNPPVHQQMMVHQTQEYSGDIPHPDILAGFDRLVPGAAARLVDAALAETDHRRRLELQITEGNVAAQAAQVRIAEGQVKAIFKSDVLGQALGFLTCFVAIGAAVWLGMAGHEWLAAGIAAIPTAAVIQAFRANFFTRKEPALQSGKEGK